MVQGGRREGDSGWGARVHLWQIHVDVWQKQYSIVKQNKVKIKIKTKINSKWIKDLNVRPETIKLLEENTGRTLNDTNQSKILYDLLLRVMEIKTKVNKWNLIKLRSFCTAKETISKVKRQPLEWEKIIANETTDKGLIPKIHKQFIQLNTRKTNNPIKKWGKYLDISLKKTQRWLTNI